MEVSSLPEVLSISSPSSHHFRGTTSVRSSSSYSRTHSTTFLISQTPSSLQHDERNIHFELQNTTFSCRFSSEAAVEQTIRHGSGDDAFAFLKSMTSKRFPSMSVVFRVFEALLKASRQNEAQDLLPKCLGYVRNNADFLNLFCSMKPGQVVAAYASLVLV